MLQKILLGFLLILSCTLVEAQKNTLTETIELQLGVSLHGSGDMTGFSCNTEYRRYVKQRIFLAVGLGATWNDKQYSIYYTDPTGRAVDGSLRDAIAGFQLAGKAGWDFLQRDQHSLGIMIGPLLRYQTSTVADYREIIFPASGIGFPVPVTYYVHLDPQRTLTVGGIVQVSYRHKLGQRIFSGVVAGFQTDSNGDALPQLCVSVGVKL